ncbi:potassium-transporting ATPase subunit C [Streptomyces microflavus]|uniref:potassium-transporting ATPase subunit C n=1 Tax=Streptomyces microflavus TaxID=1919 RepID=UPI003691E43C
MKQGYAILAVTGAAQALLPGRANGSPVTSGGRTVGSNSSASATTCRPERGGRRPGPDLRWFQPRPSNGLPTNSVNTRYDLLVSGATNRSGDNEELIRWVTEAKAAVVADNSVPGHRIRPQDVPPDAVTSSGSGLDPHISPAYAELQVHRVAQRDHLDAELVEGLVADHTEGRTLGFAGEPRGNVLKLNIALKELVDAG